MRGPPSPTAENFYASEGYRTIRHKSAKRRCEEVGHYETKSVRSDIGRQSLPQICHKLSRWTLSWEGKYSYRLMEFIETTINTAQAARLVGVTHASINLYRNTGRLPTITVMGRPAYFRADIERLMVERRDGFPVGRPKKGSK